jgi:hypothetical protein
MTNPIPCPHCEDGLRWVSRYGGNDPNVWSVECEDCEGTGVSICGCYERRGTNLFVCREVATEQTEDGPCCAKHASLWHEDHLDEYDEDEL